MESTFRPGLRSAGWLGLLAVVTATASTGCGTEFVSSGEPDGGAGAGGCPPGYGDCDPEPGCETDLQTSVDHCGGCTNDCTALAWPNVTSYGCDAGACAIAACAAGFAHCDDSNDNGCEIASDTDPSHCGGCGVVCSSGICEDGRCVHALYAPWALHNWGSSIPGSTQWSSPVVLNPTEAPVNVSVQVHRADSSEPPHAFSKEIAARAAWVAHGDADWLALPPSGATSALGWVELRSSAEVVAVNFVDIRQGASHDGVLTHRDLEPFASELDTTLTAWAFLKNWVSPTTGDTSHSQWSSLVLCNPHRTEEMVTINVRERSSGELLSSFNKWIEPHRWWNAYADAEWTNAGAESEFGWVEVTATAPVLGLNRWVLREGAAHDGVATLFDDLTLTAEPRTEQVASIYLKRWPWRSGGPSQWSNLLIGNPNDGAASATVTVHRTDGSGTLGQFTTSIPGRGAWYSKGDPAWAGIGESDPTYQRSIGWIEVSSDLPVTANHITDYVAGPDEGDLLVLRDVNQLTGTATTLLAPLYLRSWPVGDGAGKKQETSIAVTNGNDSPVTLTVTVRRIDTGEVLSTFDETVASKASWNSYDDTDWQAVPDTEPGAAIGWVTVEATAPVAGSVRYRVLDDGNAIFLSDEHPLLVVGD